MKFNYYFQLGLSAISLFILFSIYGYLNSIKDCSCFVENEHDSYKINLEFLKFYQILEIISLVIFVILITMYKNKLKGGKRDFGMQFFVILSTLILLFITGYVTYNSLLFYLMSKKNCKCANQWQKYFIYIQGVFNSIYFLRLLYLLLFVVLLILFNYK